MHYINVWQKWNWTKFKESQNVVQYSPLHSEFKKDEDEEISLIAKFTLNWKINVN